MTYFPEYMQVVAIALEAGKRIMRFYDGAPLDIHHKEDKSPVTLADMEAHHYIAGQLAALFPAIPVVSEEFPAEINEKARQSERFWLVDPLDGTKSFIRKTDEFTVNIALIEGDKPVLGVIYVPAKAVLYYTDGLKALKQEENQVPQPIQVRNLPAAGAVVVASLMHRDKETDGYISTLKVQSVIAAASSVKLCLVAEGTADYYPRFGPTMEWDIAAGHAILNAAGGTITQVDGSPFIYGKKGFLNPFFIARGKS